MTARPATADAPAVPGPPPTDPATTHRPTPWWRPVVHATPRRAWMNDPNGLVRHGGRYHLFFQHHLDGVVWGPMSWGHATSPDLVHWTEHPVAIPATPTEWVFSGCAVHEPAPEQDRLVAVYTAVDPATGRQTQALATSRDGGSTWQRHPANPVLDVGSTEFRDPKVFRHGGAWVMVVVLAVEHVVQVYRSEDLVTWELTGTVGPYENPPGPDGAPVSERLYWEVPDLVRLPVVDDPTTGDGCGGGRGDGREEWALLLSVNPGGPAGGSGQAYAVGTFDGRTFLPDPVQGDAFGPFSWADHGPDLYAASTFSDPPGELPADGRPVWIGWMSNWLYADRTPTAPWRGAATIARSLALREIEGRLRLVQRPVLADLPAARPVPPGVDGSGAATRLPDAALVRFDVRVPPGGEAGTDLLVGAGAAGGNERTRVVVRNPADGGPPVLVVDRTRSGTVEVHPGFPVAVSAPLPGVVPDLDGAVTAGVEVVVDTSSVEVFAAGGATSVTALVFPAATSRGLRTTTSRGGVVLGATVTDLA